MPDLKYDVLGLGNAIVDVIARYGRSNLEEVFLDIARGTGEAREAAR